MAPPFFTCNPFTHAPCPPDMECRLVDYIYLCVERPEDPLPDCEPEGAVRCNATGSGVVLCSDGRWELSSMCGGDVPYCVDGECYMCPKGTLYCRGADVWQCAEDGLSTHHLQECNEPAGEMCHDGRCVNGCTWAEQEGSHLGCRFLSVPTANPFLDSAFLSEFGIAVHNPNLSPATVQVLRSGSTVATYDLDASRSVNIRLEMDPDLKQDPRDLHSVLLGAGSYEVVSTIPVAAFQFNPASAQVNRRCEDSSGSAPCRAETAGGTLLLPAHLLSTRYHVLTLESATVYRDPEPFVMPGFFAVTALEDQTDVEITLSGRTCNGPGLPAYDRGEIAFITLYRGEVLQILSAVDDPPPGTADLAGTFIDASAPVAVFAGHGCAATFPMGAACGRMEEQIPPVELAGREHVLVPMVPTLTQDPHLNYYRILSLAEGNTLTFEPLTVQPQITIGKGEVLNVTTQLPFRVTSTERVLVGQFSPESGWPDTSSGAPSFVQVLPVSRYATFYGFHVPELTEGVTVAVVTPFEQISLVLDGWEFSADRIDQIGSSYAVFWAELDTGYTATGHYFRAGQPVGLFIHAHRVEASWLFSPGMAGTD